jgi:hypothetical protein
MRILALALLLLTVQDPKPSPATFTRDVAPVVFAHCALCHRPGDTAPFSLLEYGDLKKRAKQILEVVESRRMPPWKPIEGHGEFVGERRLKPAEIATIRAWVDQGCEEGDAKDLPPLPKFPDGWALGEPDLVVTMPEAYTVPAEGKDIMRAFVLPLNLTEDKYVRAVQFRPSHLRVVHHALFFMDPTKESRQKEAADPEPGFDGRQLPFGAILGGALASWNPGAVSKFYPDGMAKELKKSSDLVMQVHFNPMGRSVQEKSQIGIWFTKEPPRRMVVPLPMFNMKIDLPPGEKDLQVRDRYIVPVDIDLIGIIPHAHYLARECRVWAKTPDGKELPLIWIKDWDFDWQEQYRYKEMIRLTTGTEINMVWTFDNTSGNPKNPANPPVRVKYGEASKDEMATVGLQVATFNSADKMKLYYAVLAKPRD